MKAWHVTSVSALDSIRQEGLRPYSYWATCKDLRDYYVETVIDEGLVPAIFEATVETLEGFYPEPDYPGIEEPICTVLGKTEDQILHLWSKSDRSWHACVEIVSSFRVVAAIPDVSGFTLLPGDV